MSITKRPWGTVAGQTAHLFTLDAGPQLRAIISDYGGLVHSLWVPDRHGQAANVVLGLHDPESYHRAQTYFGALVGRYANRIAGASFTLGGQRYELPANNGQNTLHGGPDAWSFKVWEAETLEAEDSLELRLRHVDPDGCNGFPGTVRAEVVYAATPDGSLSIDYRATSDRPTVINLTNHTYFNLAGEGSGDALGQLLQIHAGRFLPVDDSGIPLGSFSAVEGTPFDFREPKPMGRDIAAADMPGGDQLSLARGYDHNWVLDGSGLRLAAIAADPASGRMLEVQTTEPGVQFYSGNLLDGELAGPGGRCYRQSAGFALETQHYPDTPHHLDDPEWPSVVLEPGATFASRTVYRFSARATAAPAAV